MKMLAQQVSSQRKLYKPVCVALRSYTRILQRVVVCVRSNGHKLSLLKTEVKEREA